MQIYSVTEAKAKFAEIVSKAAAGENIIITRMGKPIVRMEKNTPKSKKKNLVGLFAHKPFYMADDFDEWPEDIARDLGMID